MMRNETIRFIMLRNGSEYGFLYPAKNTAPSIRSNSGGEIKTSLQGEFLPMAYDLNGKPIEVDWLNDEIKPVLVLDGVEHSLGIFIPTTRREGYGRDGRSVQIEAYDRCWRVQSTLKENIAYFPAGMKYVDAVSALLAEAGIESIAITDTDSTLQEAREDWDIGTSNLTIANQQLSEINYKQVWFDSTGTAMIQPESNPTADNIQHILTEKKPDPRNPKEIGLVSVLPEVSRSTDIFSQPNVFICICSNADKSEGLVAMAENANPLSPLSIQSRGRRIASVEQVDNIASQEELEMYANRKASRSLMTGEIVEAKTLLQPGFGTGDVTGLQYDDIMSVCVEREWSMELKPGGLMSHTLEKVVLNIESE